MKLAAWNDRDVTLGNSGRLSDGISNLALPRVAGLDAPVFLADSTADSGEAIVDLKKLISQPISSRWQ